METIQCVRTSGGTVQEKSHRPAASRRRGNGEAGEFVFGFDWSVGALTAGHDVQVPEAGEDAEGDADADGDEGERGGVFLPAVLGVDDCEGLGKEVNNAPDRGAHDGDHHHDRLGDKYVDGTEQDHFEKCLGVVDMI